jgi:hypothetical protein
VVIPTCGDQTGAVHEAIRDHPRLELQVIAAASALLDRLGGAVNVLEEAGFRPSVKIRLIVEGQTPATMARVSARRGETARSLVTVTPGHRRHPPPGHRHPRARAGGGGSGGRLERAAVEAEGHHQGCAGHGVGDDAGVEAEHPSHQVLGHDLAGRALGHDAAAGHGHQVVGVAAGVVEAVEDEHHGAALGGVESGEQVEHLHLVGQIQERGGLVEQHDGCALGQGHGDPRPLALAAGELVDRSVGQLGDGGGHHGGGDHRLVLGRPTAGISVGGGSGPGPPGRRR